jgi:hypothetical protein
VLWGRRLALERALEYFPALGWLSMKAQLDSSVSLTGVFPNQSLSMD